MEKLAGDLLFGLKLVKKPINSPNTVHIICLGQFGRIKIKLLGLKGLS